MSETRPLMQPQKDEKLDNKTLTLFRPTEIASSPWYVECVPERYMVLFYLILRFHTNYRGILDARLPAVGFLESETKTDLSNEQACLMRGTSSRDELIAPRA